MLSPAEIADKLGARPSGPRKWTAHCPAHDDTIPSLSIGTGEGDKLLLHCHAGCTFDSIYASLGNGRPLPLKANTPNGTQNKPTAIYDYTDEAGNLLYQVIRFGNGFGKTFKYRRPDGKGDWTWNLDGIRRVPYNLSKIVGAERVFLAEGEKDADALTTLGYISTSSKGIREEHAEIFCDKEVFIIPDLDEAGMRIAEKVALSLNGIAATVKIISLPGLPQGGDFSDFLSMRSADTADLEFTQLIDEAPEWMAEKQPQARRFQFLAISEVYTATRPADWLIKGYLDRGTFGAVYGAPGTMKSFLMIDIGMTIATDFDKWHGAAVRKKGPVFYICGEGFGGIGRRIKAWCKAHDVKASDIPFFVSSAAAQVLAPESISEIASAIEELQAQRGEPVLIIVDTLNRNFGPGDENSTSDMTAFIAALDDLRSRFNSTILLAHHTGLMANDRARGSSALRAALDWEYRLDVAADGATRTLTCTKSKDHEPPATIHFKAETIWLDDIIEEEGEIASSVVLHRIDAPSAGGKPLTGAKKIAYNALVSVMDEGIEGVPVDTWREAAYRANISASDDPSARRKAFSRAVTGLRDSGLVKVQEDFAYPIEGQRDRTGTKEEHVPTHVRQIAGTDRDTTL